MNLTLCLPNGSIGPKCNHTFARNKTMYLPNKTKVIIAYLTPKYKELE